MTSITRQVLNYFGETHQAVSLAELTLQLQLAPGVLQGILDYWVRKGELREVNINTNVCHTCSVHKACPFVMALPHYYERVGSEISQTFQAPCSESAPYPK